MGQRGSVRVAEWLRLGVSMSATVCCLLLSVPCAAAACCFRLLLSELLCCCLTFSVALCCSLLFSVVPCCLSIPCSCFLLLVFVVAAAAGCCSLCPSLSLPLRPAVCELCCPFVAHMFVDLPATLACYKILRCILANTLKQWFLPPLKHEPAMLQ